MRLSAESRYARFAEISFRIVITLDSHPSELFVIVGKIAFTGEMAIPKVRTPIFNGFLAMICHNDVV